MNHLGTWLKRRFRFNRSGVEPNTWVSNKLQWTFMLQICKPHFSSTILVSLSSQIWSTFYLKVSLWLVIYQENYIGQKTQNLFMGWFYPVHRCSLTFAAQTVDLSSSPDMPFPSCLAEWQILAQPHQPHLMPLCQQLKHLKLKYLLNTC